MDAKKIKDKYFLIRQEKQNIAEKAFEQWCIKNNIQWARSGLEQLTQSPDFRNLIQRLSDRTSKQIRFFPDFVAAFNSFSTLVEAKNSRTIEKSAYDVYVGLRELGYKVLLVIYLENNLWFCPIENVVIQKQTEKDIPIIDKKWIAPRIRNENWTDEKYFKWKEKYGGSGTTYGYIDFQNFQQL